MFIHDNARCGSVKPPAGGVKNTGHTRVFVNLDCVNARACDAIRTIGQTRRLNRFCRLERRVRGPESLKMGD